MFTNGNNTTSQFTGEVTITNNDGSGRSISFMGPVNGTISGFEIVNSANTVASDSVLTNQTTTSTTSGLTIFLTSNTYDAFAFLIQPAGNSTAQSTTYIFYVNGNTTTPAGSVVAANGIDTFVGFTSNTPINSVEILKGLGAEPAIEDVITANPVAVPTTPEPSSLILVGTTGLAGVARLLRAKRLK